MAFQTVIAIEHEERLRIRVFGSNVYRVYFNGEHLIDGPARFAEQHPEFDEYERVLMPGRHLLTTIVHYYGVSTRMTTANIPPPFLQVEVLNATESMELTWKCKEITTYRHLARRVNEQLGWMEYCDMRALPAWDDEAASSSGWHDPIEMNNPLFLADYRAATIDHCLTLPTEASSLAKGCYINRFGYENDDAPVRFMMRDLAPVG